VVFLLLLLFPLSGTNYVQIIIARVKTEQEEMRPRKKSGQTKKRLNNMTMTAAAALGKKR
jgi:hypothetical protein